MDMFVPSDNASEVFAHNKSVFEYIAALACKLVLWFMNQHVAFMNDAGLFVASPVAIDSTFPVARLLRSKEPSVMAANKSAWIAAVCSVSVASHLRQFCRSAATAFTDSARRNPRCRRCNRVVYESAVMAGKE